MCLTLLLFRSELQFLKEKGSARNQPIDYPIDESTETSRRIQLDLIATDSSAVLRAAPAIFVSHLENRGLADPSESTRRADSTVSAGHDSMRGNLLRRSFFNFPRCDMSLVALAARPRMRF